LLIEQGCPLTRQHGLARRWPALAALLLASLLAGHPGPVAVPAASVAVLGPSPLAISEGVPAREPLRDIHAGLVKTGEAPASSRYIHTRQQIWSVHDTPEAKGGVAQEVQRWRATDRSARELRVTLPSEPSATPIIRVFEPGTFPLDFERPSPLPEILAGQLASAGRRLPGPELYLRAIATMFKNHCLDNAQRAAVVRILADTDGLEFHTGIVDRASRAGVAVSATSPSPADGGEIRDVLVFNPQTGALLSHEQVLQVSTPRSAVRQAAAYSYVLYLACDYTEQGPSS
jgi:hypothetical protein